jgi:ribonuclease E
LIAEGTDAAIVVADTDVQIDSQQNADADDGQSVQEANTVAAAVAESEEPAVVEHTPTEVPVVESLSEDAASSITDEPSQPAATASITAQETLGDVAPPEDSSGLTAEGRAVNDPRVAAKPVTEVSVRTEQRPLFPVEQAPALTLVPSDVPRASNDPRGPRTVVGITESKVAEPHVEPLAPETTDMFEESASSQS